MSWAGGDADSENGETLHEFLVSQLVLVDEDF